jgi:calcineurin-like phosphoesterase
MLKILFIGDISGRIGRKTIAKILPKLKKKLRPDIVIANADNIAHGVGVTPETLKEIFAAGVDWATNGDHAFDREKQIKACYENGLPVLRPANYSSSAPGNGYAIVKSGKHKILLIKSEHPRQRRWLDEWGRLKGGHYPSFLFRFVN